MYEIKNKTFGELKFGDTRIGVRSAGLMTKENYKKYNQEITYAEVHDWCIVMEVPEKKEVQKEEKKEVQKEVQKEVPKEEKKEEIKKKAD